MWFWDRILTPIFSAAILFWTPKCSVTVEANQFKAKAEMLENVEENNISTPKIPNMLEIKKKSQKQISVCLTTDDKNSFTHKRVLERISDPNNTILEFPLSQLYKKYWDHDHPLVVRGLKRDFRTLLWKDWIEKLMVRTKQKLNSRTEKITSDTKYEVWDTIRFLLINPLLKDDFKQYLSDQLKEEWFEEFIDPDASIINKIINKKSKNGSKNSNFIYDIVVKKVPSWRDALAVYRNWKLFMATYASIWKNKYKTRSWKWVDPRTKLWQYKIIKKDPYKRSIKHNDAPMSFGLNYYWWYWIHQWNVTWYPASHWCVRIPWIYSDMLYSLVKDTKSVDVFISKNLYNSKK